MTDPINSNLSAPSGSDLGEGVVEQLARRFYEAVSATSSLSNDPASRISWKEAQEHCAPYVADLRTFARVALSTPSSTLTPDAEEAAYRAFVDRAVELTGTSEEDALRNIDEDGIKSFRDALGCAVRAALKSATPAIRDKDEQLNRDLRTAEYIDAAEAEIARLQAELDAGRDKAFRGSGDANLGRAVSEARTQREASRINRAEFFEAIRALKGTPIGEVE